MAPHVYERVPLDDVAPHSNPQNPTYFTGLPTTAPPSFHTVELQSSSSPFSTPSSALPHRNDETVATFIPHNQRPFPAPASQPQTLISETDDPSVSLWASSGLDSNGDSNAAREDLLVRLMDRIEAIEKRLDSSPCLKDEVDLEAAKKKPEENIGRNEVLKGLYAIVMTSIVLGWLGAVIVFTAKAKHSGGNESN